MAENTVENVANASGATSEAKVSDTASSLPPVTKEPVATAEASMVPSITAEPTTTDEPTTTTTDATDTPAKPETSGTSETQEGATGEPSGANAPDSQPEKPSDPAPVPATQSETTETAASGAESGGVPSGPSDQVVVPPKPVSLEEIRDEDLPDAPPSEPEKPAEPSQTDTVEDPPVKNGEVHTGDKRKAEAVEDDATPEADNTKDSGAEPPEKQAKTNGTATNGAARKPGRPRKDKKAAPIVGRTERKTRSQGAADHV